MRWYTIKFSGQPSDFPNLQVPLVYSSLDNSGNFNPGALEVKFDIVNAVGHLIGKSGHLRIHNVPLSICQRARYYQGLDIVIYAGFMNNPTTGFKLVRPKQSGVIGWGKVQACIPNYMGTEMVMDFIIIPSFTGSPELSVPPSRTSTPTKPYNFLWKPNTSFIEAVKATFNPLGITVTGSVDSRVLNNTNRPIDLMNSTYYQFANFINTKTRVIVNQPLPTEQQTYDGVEMTFTDPKTVFLSDNTGGRDTVRLEIDEFIGQPSIFTPYGLQIQSVHPLRSDVLVSGYVQYPAISAQVGLLPVAGTQNRPLTGSNKKLKVNQVRHIGTFRDTSPQGWATYVIAGSVLDPMEA